MKNKLLVVINPISGTGKQKGVDKIIKDRIDSNKYEIDIIFTQYAGHASIIAKEAVEKSFNTLVVVGGDGTVNEVVKELIDTDITLGIIPCGSGNGLARHLGIPMNTKKAIDSINTFVAHKIDTLSINEHKCVNVAGIGFDALISYEFANMTKRGLVSYFKSVVKNYFSYKNQKYTIEINGETKQIKAFLLSIANSSQYGNNAYISPSARIDDGLVDIVAIKKPKIFQIPTIAIALFAKSIDNTLLCTTLEASEFTISHDNEIGHIDGEPLKLGKILKVKVNPRSLNILVNPKKENIMMNFSKLFPKRYISVLLFVLLFVSISFVIRTVLLFFDVQSLDLSFSRLLGIYIFGLFYDLIACSYFLIPFVIYNLLIPDKIFNAKIHKYISYLFFIIAVGILVFSSVSEWFFWEEFSVRFNFIAVDYLVYTTEVISNIQESYPMPILASGMIAVSALIFFFVRKYFNMSFSQESTFLQRLKVTAILLTIPLLSWFTVTDRTLEIKTNAYCNELGHNGIYQIFSAFLNNELDYNSFYQTAPDKELFANLRKLVETDNSTFVNKDSFDITRDIVEEGEEKHYNLIMVTVESLSAEFFTRFGNTKGITPFLDSLASKSLMFTNFYATGTRTVRGMEALTLSVPPTPGCSVVKRKNNENMYSLGNVLKSKGYSNSFIYAGNGYFDNMNYFFGNNGYDIVDLGDFTAEEISFKNAWGVCDEDLFDKAIKVADKAYKEGKAFSNFIMTTSNHRPFTYPDGKIDIPSHTGRDGAVKYTDYAIKQLFEKAAKYPWFDNTIFVVVADHCAGSAGETSLPVHNYHIPLFVYAPKIIEPKEIDALCSQIDFAPTVLGLMNMSYRSKFFGKNVLKYNPNRALIGTYQKIGLLKGDKLTVQSPVRRTESFDLSTGKQLPCEQSEQDLFDAISYYQSASYLFNHKGLLYDDKK